jgi:hypothetical protein
MMFQIWDAAEREERRLAAINRFVGCEITEQTFRVELARCGLTATEIEQAVNDHREARRKGTPFG